MTAIEAAYRIHHDQLVRELTRIVQPADAEDVVATAWAIAPRRGIDGDPSSVRGYVWIVAGRLAWKLAQRERPEPLSENHEDPVDTLRAHEAWTDVLRAASTLRPRARRTLGLAVAGLEREDFARVTGDSWRTVDRQIGRARPRLRQLADG